MLNPQKCTLLFPNTDLTIGFLPFVAVVISSRGNPENKIIRIFWRVSVLKQWIHYPSNTTALQVISSHWWWQMHRPCLQAELVLPKGVTKCIDGFRMPKWNSAIIVSQRNHVRKLYTSQSIETDAIMKRKGFLQDEGKLEGWPWPFLSELALVYALYSELSVVSWALRVAERTNAKLLPSLLCFSRRKPYSFRSLPAMDL